MKVKLLGLLWGLWMGPCHSGACYRRVTGNSLLAQDLVQGTCRVVCTSPSAWSSFVSIPLLIFSILFLSHCPSRTFLFFPFINFFNWSVVDLECCVSFRCTVKWFSHTYIYTHIYINLSFFRLFSIIGPSVTFHIGFVTAPKKTKKC